jgi:histidine triad (HIT) family protein
MLYPGKWAIIIRPLNPVTEGHALVIPKQHAEYIWELDEDVLRYTINDVAGAAYLLAEDCNVIQSNGEAATQTVKHVHFHLVPRREGDGLHLPWTGQKVGSS